MSLFLVPIWGLGDFMLEKETAVTNAIQPAFFVACLLQRLLLAFREESSQAGVMDLKASLRGHYYASETWKMFLQKPEPILFQHITRFVATLGSAHSLSQRARVA